MYRHRLILVMLTLTILSIVILSTSGATAYGFSYQSSTDTAASYTTQYEDTKGIAMSAVPEGTFKIGYTVEQVLNLCQKLRPQNATYDCDRISPLGPNSLDDSYSLEPSEITVKTFYLDKYEVSRADYLKCVQDDVCSDHPFNIQPQEPVNVPIQGANYYDAAIFCAWRGARLPTEIEWEYAARGIENFTFPWGNDFVGSNTNFCDRNCNASAETTNNLWDDKYVDLAPVDEYENGKSWAGIYNLAGNIAEWTSTRVSPRDKPKPNDFRVVKGGSYASEAHQVTGFSRFWIEATNEGQQTIGFRCARTTTP